MSIKKDSMNSMNGEMNNNNNNKVQNAIVTPTTTATTTNVLQSVKKYYDNLIKWNDSNIRRQINPIKKYHKFFERYIENVIDLDHIIAKNENPFLSSSLMSWYKELKKRKLYHIQEVINMLFNFRLTRNNISNKDIYEYMEQNDEKFYKMIDQIRIYQKQNVKSVNGFSNEEIKASINNIIKKYVYNENDMMLDGDVYNKKMSELQEILNINEVAYQRSFKMHFEKQVDNENKDSDKGKPQKKSQGEKKENKEKKIAFTNEEKKIMLEKIFGNNPIITKKKDKTTKDRTGKREIFKLKKVDWNFSFTIYEGKKQTTKNDFVLVSKKSINHLQIDDNDPNQTFVPNSGVPLFGLSSIKNNTESYILYIRDYIFYTGNFIRNYYNNKFEAPPLNNSFRMFDIVISSIDNNKLLFKMFLNYPGTFRERSGKQNVRNPFSNMCDLNNNGKINPKNILELSIWRKFEDYSIEYVKYLIKKNYLLPQILKIIDNKKLVRISMDNYIRRHTYADDKPRWHRDTDTGLDFALMLSFKNENEIVGTEIYQCSALQSSKETTCFRIIRPQIPINGTIMLSDNNCLHSSPFNLNSGMNAKPDSNINPNELQNQKMCNNLNASPFQINKMKIAIEERVNSAITGEGDKRISHNTTRPPFLRFLCGMIEEKDKTKISTHHHQIMIEPSSSNKSNSSSSSSSFNIFSTGKKIPISDFFTDDSVDIISTPNNTEAFAYLLHTDKITRTGGGGKKIKKIYKKKRKIKRKTKKRKKIITKRKKRKRKKTKRKTKK